MYYKTYDYITGDVIDRVEAFDFGDILQNQHSAQPLVFRAFSDDSTAVVTDLVMYLEDKGAWSDTQYGVYISQSFVPSIESGSDVFTPLILVPDATAGSPGDMTVGWDTTSSYYVWLDAQASIHNGTSNANYRFFYNYT